MWLFCFILNLIDLISFIGFVVHFDSVMLINLTVFLGIFWCRYYFFLLIRIIELIKFLYFLEQSFFHHRLDYYTNFTLWFRFSETVTSYLNDVFIAQKLLVVFIIVKVCYPKFSYFNLFIIEEMILVKT